MKNVQTNRIVSLLLAIVMMLSIVPISTISVSASGFTIRSSAPSKSNEYYYSSKNPFYSAGYAGQCTWYAYGRAYEILGKKPNLSTGNAKEWYGYNKSKGYYKYGQTPKVGAIVCWANGTYGHVGVVEKVISETDVYVSEANVDGGNWRYRHYNPKTWNANFQGYIYLLDDTGTHTHSYSGSYFEAAHPHKVYQKCSCGATKYTGATRAYQNCSTCMKKSTKYPVPIKAYTLATGKTTVYSEVGGKAKTNKIYDTDLCTISQIYDCGWCKVTFPLDAGGTETGYVKTSVFFNPSYSVFTIKANSKITTYSRSNLSKSIGYAALGDTVYVIGHTSSAVQIAYPLASGGYKAGWVPNSYFKYTVKYNANGGTGSMSSTSMQYQSNFTISASKYTRAGYTFAGWNVKRTSDSKWHYSGQGWYTEANAPSGAQKSIYAAGKTYAMNASWLKSGATKDTVTFYAIWQPNTLSVAYHANGGMIVSDKYKLTNNLVYKKADNSKLVQTWTYNKALTDGLYNAATFGLTKTGYTFKAWASTASGGTLFDQNDTKLVPTSINANIKNGNCSSTLYAIWQPNTYTIKYNANGGSGTMSNSSHTYDTAKALSANQFTRAGYTFLGWSTGTSATTATYTDKQSVKNLTATNNGTVTLYAVWQKNAEPITVSSVSIYRHPEKTSFTVGDKLDTTGLQIKVTMSDGSTKILSSGFTVSTPDMSTVGNKHVIVSYGGKTAQYTIWVGKAVQTADGVLTVGSQSAAIGQTVQVPVRLDAADISMLTVSLSYDAAKLKYVSCSDSAFDVVDINSSTAGTLIFSGIADNGLPKGEIILVTFEVVAAEACNTQITASVKDAYSLQEKKIELETAAGTISITNGGLLGDVNGDGKVNIIDARWLLQVSSGNRTLTAQQAAVADVNKDGKINIIDARWLLQVSSGNRVL